MTSSLETKVSEAIYLMCRKNAAKLQLVRLRLVFCFSQMYLNIKI